MNLAITNHAITNLSENERFLVLPKGFFVEALDCTLLDSGRGQKCFAIALADSEFPACMSTKLCETVSVKQHPQQ